MFRADGLNLLFNEKVIYRAIDKIYEIVHQDDSKAVIRYFSLDYANYRGYMDNSCLVYPDIEDEEDFKLINRNVLCIDKDGNEVWRIENPAPTDNRADSFINVFFRENEGKWKARTHNGHMCDIDLKTGKLSNIRHFATK